MNTRRPDYLLLAALACALAAGAYAALRFLAPYPPDGGPALYALIWAYNYTALPVSIVVVLGALTALFYWLPLAIVKRPGFRRGGALVALAALAALVSVWAALPLGRLIYREVPGGTLTAAGQTHILGVRVSGDAAQNVYTLCSCPGLVCACRHLPPDASLTTLEPLPVITADDAGRVTVRVDGRVLYEK